MHQGGASKGKKLKEAEIESGQVLKREEQQQEDEEEAGPVKMSGMAALEL